MSRDISFHVALRAGPFRASGRAGAAGRKRLHPESCNNLFLSQTEAPRRCPPAPPASPHSVLVLFCVRGVRQSRCWVSSGAPEAAGASCPLAMPLATGTAHRGGAGHGAVDRLSPRAVAGTPAGQGGQSGAGARPGRFRHGTGMAVGPGPWCYIRGAGLVAGG